MKSKILFCGLGTMGYPMAGHLVQKLDPASFEVFVYNRTIKKAEKWQREFKGVFLNKKELLEKANEFHFVFSCLGQDEDVEAFLLDKNFLYPRLSEGSMVVDHSTISYRLAKKLSEELKKKKIAFMDAPISGGEIGAQKGILTVMAGGSEIAFKEAAPFLRAYSRKIVLVGEVGSGQLAKMINQICIAGLLQGLSEGIRFARQEKLDFSKVLEAISGGAAQSWQMDNRAKTMHRDEYDFGFKIKWMVKDLKYALEQGRSNGAKLPITEEIWQRYKDLAARGHGNKDTSALKLYED